MILSPFDDFEKQIDCIYKNEKYSVRDNGAVLRHGKEGCRPRPSDNVWTFGKPNNKTGYMIIASVRVHRIVASAFHGEAPTKEYVVDHIDTNKRNNRPENLRWVTKLENILLNPITVKRIEFVCGCSIEEFLQDPSKYKDKFQEPNFSWMGTVNKEEAKNSLERLLSWASSESVPTGGTLGEWVFRRESYYQEQSTECIFDGEKDWDDFFAPTNRPAKPIDLIEEIMKEVAATTDTKIYKTTGEIMGAVQDLLKAEPSLMLPDLKLDLCDGHLLIEKANLERFEDIQFVFEGRIRTPRYVYLIQGQQRLALVVRIKGYKNDVKIEDISNELGVIMLDLTWAKQGLNEDVLRKLLATDHPKKSWIIHNKENKRKVDETAEKLLKVCEPLRYTGHGVAHSYVACPLVPEPYNGRNGVCSFMECGYCTYRFTADDIEVGGCFGKSKIETYEDLMSVVDVKKQDEQITSITFKRNGKLKIQEFDFFDPDANALGKSLLTLWEEKKGEKLVALNKRSDWYVLVEEDQSENIKKDGIFYARLARDLQSLSLSRIRSIFAYEEKDWEEIDVDKN